MAKKRLVVGNWKMYITKEAEAKKFVVEFRRKARGIPGVESWIAPPFTLLPAVGEALKSSPIYVGAQTISAYTEEKHTGDVSAVMLKDVGASFAIIGHSERRLPNPASAVLESNEIVRAQMQRALEANMTPILCIGERERDMSGSYVDVLHEQLTSAIKDLPPKGLSKIIIAYEPVWAIGKSAEDAMKPIDLQETVIFIRKTLTELMGRKMAQRIGILYGGSVEAANALGLLTEGGVSGFLVGHASTEVDAFVSILKALRTTKK